jgi:two-component system sensor histidine kinase CpxA
MGKRIRMNGPEQHVMQLDGTLIQRAVENVIRNALKYTANDTAVEVSIVEETSGVRIVIDDHGPGVPEELINQIFEPFFRVGEARRTQSGSGGVGLAIAERSVRLHGGAVRASNRDGSGLRVEMDIPALSAV